MDIDVLATLSRLMYPGKREHTLELLRSEGVLSSETADLLGKKLSEGRYSYRTVFNSISTVQIELSQFIDSHKFNKFRGTEAVDMINGYRSGGDPRPFDLDRLRGASVLDFGAGIFSPLKVAIVLYANGADRVVAFEPAPWRPYFMRQSTARLIAQMNLEPSAFCISGISAKEMRTRLADIDFDGNLNEASGEIDLGPVKLTSTFDFAARKSDFDLILSTSVLEHVDSVERELENKAACLRSGGVAINRIDFTDHRHSKPEFAPFGFYYDGVAWSCNLKRVSDVDVAAGKLNGCAYELINKDYAKDEDVDLDRILGRFKGYDRETLLTKAATLVLRKE